jgi:hypothetical protein
VQSGVGAFQLSFESGAEIFERGAMLGDEGEVGQFLWVGFEVVEFLDFVGDEGAGEGVTAGFRPMLARDAEGFGLRASQLSDGDLNCFPRLLTPAAKL